MAARTPIWALEVPVLDSTSEMVAGSLAGQVVAIKAITDVIPDAGAFTAIATDAADAAEEATEIAHHFHTRSRVFGLAAAPSGTHWGDQATLTPYRAISGAGTWGIGANDSALVIGSGDTPAIIQIPAMTYFDLHRILISAMSHATPYIIRIIYGTGTEAAAVAAGQFTNDIVMTTAAPAAQSRGVFSSVPFPKVAAGTKVWVSVKNATDDAWIDFFVGLHEYTE